MAEDDELEALRRRRVQELQRQQQGSGQDDEIRDAVQSQQADQERAMREQLMRQILTPEARERLERLRMARGDHARQLENQLISLAQSGRLGGKVDDEQLKQILARIGDGQRDINIRRK
jgi:programmed cell death protein 5